MCLVLFAYKVSKKYPLVLAANRDEFYDRPTAPMQFWKTRPDLLAGQDLEQGGTWFGVTKSGRFAALTNIRDPSSVKPSARSRGEIIVNFLCSGQTCEDFGKHLKKDADRYNGYNLLFGDCRQLFWFSSLKKEMKNVGPGIHGLSNRHLDTDWPKVIIGKEALAGCLKKDLSHGMLLSLLQDGEVPPDHLLPDTGVGQEWERILAPLFIKSPTYGTRSSTIMTIDEDNRLLVTERTYEPCRDHDPEDRAFSISPANGDG